MLPALERHLAYVPSKYVVDRITSPCPGWDTEEAKGRRGQEVTAELPLGARGKSGC